MKNNPVVSIIVPIFKVEKYLPSCIDSILNQSFCDFELILVDDGSPDNCGAICDNYKNVDKRILVIHKNNGGLSSARNAGIDIATGSFISFVDGDDVLDKCFLEKLLDLFDEEIDFSMCKFSFFESDKKIVSHVSSSKIEILDEYNFWMKHFGQGNKPSCCNKLFRKKLFDNIRFKENVVSEDEFIMHWITSQCRKIAFCDEELYFYRMREGSIIHTRNTEQINNLLVDIYLDRCLCYSQHKKDLRLFLYWYYKCYYLLIQLLKVDKSKIVLEKRAKLGQFYRYKKKNNLKIAKRERIFFLSLKVFYMLKMDC